MLKNYFLIIFVLISSLSATNLKNDTLIKDEATTPVAIESSKNAFALEATIESSSESICRGESVDITFTGSGGTAPYVFEYTVDGGAIQTESTTGTSNTITITETPTATSTYQLVSVSDSSGTPEDITNATTITVNDPPDIDFSFIDNPCSSQLVQFTSEITGNAPYTYQWNFGDDIISNNENPTHAYIAEGCGTRTFDVSLTVIDNNGCSSTLIKTITVKEKPEIEFYDENPGVAGQFNNCGNSSPTALYTISVGNNSTATCIDTYNINWGDGTSSNNITFPQSHTYSSFGTFNMTISGIGSNGCINNVTYQVKNATNPSGGISGPGNTQNLCTPTDGLQFEITGWGGNTSDTTYEIDYGDGTLVNYTQDELVASIYYDSNDPSASLPFPIAPHSYTESSCPNEYTAKLWIRNACVSNPTPATIGNITILKSTESSFDAPDNDCVNTPVLFINTSISGFGFNCSPDVNFTWDFGDNSAPVTTNSLSNITHVFTNPGTYTVKLSADNTLCDVSYFEKIICIEPALTPTFTPSTTEGCAPFTVDLTDTTNLTENCGLPTYLWDVTYSPDFCGSASEYSFTTGSETSASPSITFTEAGTYSITLITTNSCGSETSGSQNIIVKQKPMVSIASIADICGPDTISPVATVDACSTNTATYNWSFPGGTPATSNQLIPDSISYTSAGNHTVTLTVSTECGSTTSTQNFTVNPKPIISNTDLSQTICSGTTSTEVILNADLASTTYSWVANATAGINGYTASGNTAIIPVQTLTTTNAASGTVTYTITPTTNGCIGYPVNLVITVNPAPAFTEQPSGSSICLDGTATPLSVSWSGTGTVTYQWYVDNAAITGANSATYNPPTNLIGTLNYYCIVSFTSGGGCDEITSASAAVEVKALLQIDTEPLASQSICIGGQSEILTVNVSGGAGTINYQWYENTTNSTIGAIQIPGETGNSYTPPVFNTLGSYFYYAVITPTGDGCGAATSAFAEIIVLDDPIIDIQPILSQELCQNAPVEDLEVTSSGGSGLFSYQWYSNTTNSSTGGTVIPGATNSTFTPPTNAVGTLYYYCIISQNSSGCETVSTASAVIILAAPTIIDQPISDSVCLDGLTSDLLVTYSNGTGVATYQWYDDNGPIAGANADSFSPATSVVGINNYHCVITFTSGGCNEITSTTAAIEVVQGPLIDTQSTSSQALCIGGVAEALSITITGGTGTIAYQWYTNTTASNTGGTPVNGATDSSYIPPAFNTVGDYYYYVIASLSANGCGAISSNPFHIQVIDDPTVDDQPLVSQELCANSTVQDLIVTVSGGLGNITYQWYSNTADSTSGGTLISTATSNTFTPPTTTIGTLYYYCIITRDVSGCITSSNTASVSITPSPTFVLQPISETLCFGDSPLDLELNYTNGTGVASYQWYQNIVDNNATGTLINGATSAIYSPSAASIGTLFYYCIVNFSSGGCTEIISTSAEITINETPNISPTAPLICSDNYFEYLPDSGNGDSVPNGTLYSWTAPSIVPTGSIIGAVEQLTPIGSISQSLINTTTNPAVVSYTVTPISGSCEGNSFEVLVTVNPAISATVNQNNSLCFEANNGSLEINISGGIPFSTGDPYQILWTGPNGFNSTAQNINALVPGDYTVDIADAGGCPYTETYTITQPEALDIQSTDVYNHITCFGENDGEVSVTISGGTLPYTYSWTNNGVPVATTEDIDMLEPGNYELTVIDANNCSYVSNIFNIDEPEVLVLSLSDQTDILCYGEDSGTITIAVTGGVPNYSYAWTGPNGFTSSSQNLSSLFAGVYILTVSDQTNCTKSLEVNLLQNDDISISYTVEEIKCYGANNGSISIDNISGGISPYTVAWSNFGAGMLQQNLSSGTYIISITDAQDCVKDFPIIIEAAPDFYIDPLVTQISCYGENDASIALNLVGGIDPLSLEWDDDPSAGVERNNLGPGTYSVTIIDGTPCTITQSFEIFDIRPLEIIATVVDALDCDIVNSGAIELSITGGNTPYTFSWSNNTQTEDLTDIPPGHYYVTITDANGCETQGDWQVLRFDPLLINVDTETEFNCETKAIKQSFIAQATGGVPPYQFNWLSGAVSGTNNEIMETDQNGLVIVEVIDSYGCTTSFSYNVETPVLGEANFSTNSIAYSSYGVYSILDPIQFTNAATGDYERIRWDFGDGNFSDEENPLHTYATEGPYVVTQMVTYPFGCIYTHVITLNIEKGYQLVMPNAFTPNADGLNDYFVPKFMGLSEMQLDIYDTWGNLLYSETGDELRGWDGKINGEEVENGNYYFKFSAKTFYDYLIKEDGAFVSIK